MKERCVIEYCVMVGKCPTTGYPLYFLNEIDGTPVLSTGDAAIFHSKEAAEMKAWAVDGVVCEVRS